MDLPSTHMSLFLPLKNEAAAPDAWAVVHARYHEVILTWCRRRGLTHACAEDLTQEVWIKLFREIHSYDPARGRLRSWLKAVVNNALTDFWRRQQRQAEKGGVGGSVFQERLAAFPSPQAIDELSGAIEQRSDTSSAALLAKVRARLHETTWQAFIQTQVEHRPAKDVARELGISISTVYKDCYRVKQMLQKETRHVQDHDGKADMPETDNAAPVPR